MELELLEESMPEEDTFAVYDYNDDYSAFDGERCGICMDIVIDRGVLDCCQHWFCFTCIDNWSTITNLCPLCQNEFQLITCVPVYDTIGSNKVDEPLYSRDDDWCIEGKTNTLSFPSYYIDENAVVCLDGEDCKIRSGSATVEEDTNFDTSIACDSCDIWYHAFCVGYDPEGACENSWLCPRCTVNEMPPKSDGVPVSMPSNQNFPENASSECLVEAAFSGKVSVSVADEGETAVVVSMIDGHQGTEKLRGDFSSTLDTGKDLKIDTLTSNSVANFPKLEMISSERISIEPKMEAQELELSLSQETSLSLPSSSLVLSALKTDPDNKEASKVNVLDGVGSSSRKLFGEPCTDELLESGLDLHLGSTLDSFMSVENINVGEDQVAGDLPLKNSLEECLLPADKVRPDKQANVIATTGTKRKYRDRRIVDDGEAKAKIRSRVSAKAKAEETGQLIQATEQAHESAAVDSKKLCSPEKKNVAADIMDIVHVTYRKSLKRLVNSNPAGVSTQERGVTSDLRVKKIMRRAPENKESFMLVQKLREDIRAAVRNKSSKENGENLFDPKLLAAFRAAVAGPITETKPSPPLDVKAKKLLLQKGKIRENLTKKIYGAGGRRRRAWTRDCEIEFWKHRCVKMTKPEKVETLKSVLDLLRKSSERTDIKYGNEGEATTSVLSRLYLADASVFPRKDDVKPFLALKGSETIEKKKEQTSKEKTSTPLLGNHSAKNPQTDDVLPNVGFPSSHNENIKITVPIIKGEAASNKVHPNKPPARPSVSALGGSKLNLPKEMVGKSDDKRSDKRKWALEVLARKMAVSEKNGAHEKQEDNAVVKGNYPLLAQLPGDMRPVLATSRHNKIPISIRQAQVYRLTEHFLRKTNLAAMRRTAETELAVADAVNIEKELADRSNSKLVYMNLCSQELLNRSGSISCDRATESNAASPSAAANTLSSDPVVEEALRNAGLLSDSPPNSPCHEMQEIKEEVEPLHNIRGEGPDNVIEIECHPDLDIYGDFEYDLEDEDFVGASTVMISKLQPEGELKMKVVFSNVIPDTSKNTLDSKNQEGPAVVELTNGNSDLFDNDTSIKSSAADSRTDDCPQNSSLDGGEELSVAECEELYGPEVDPLIKKFPEMMSTMPHEVISSDIVVGRVEDHESSQAVKASEQVSEGFAVAGSSVVGDLPNPSQISEGRPKKEKISKVDTVKQSDSYNSVCKKVEAYIKEHIRPLCKSGVITTEQYRWAVGKTTEKVMKYHSKAKNAHFLIKEGEKVKKLAEQYVEGAQWVEK